MYPLCRREHKTLGRRSPVTNVPMILQSYSWREAIASILFPESGHAPWSEAEQPGRWGAWGLGGLLGQLGLGGASAGGILSGGLGEAQIGMIVYFCWFLK